jgi:hypothetical protein
VSVPYLSYVRLERLGVGFGLYVEVFAHATVYAVGVPYSTDVRLQ